MKFKFGFFLAPTDGQLTLSTGLSSTAFADNKIN
jgi:hypothetical protein